MLRAEAPPFLMQSISIDVNTPAVQVIRRPRSRRIFPCEFSRWLPNKTIVRTLVLLFLVRVCPRRAGGPRKGFMHGETAVLCP